MAKSRQLKGRIRSVENTRKITRTLVTPELSERFPLLRQPASPAQGGPTRAAVVLVTSNRGLAGGFNANLIKQTVTRIEQLEANGYTVDLHVIGKKGIGYFKYVGRTVASGRTDIGDKPTADHAAEVAEGLIRDFAEGQLAGVDLVFAHFKSAISTPPTLVRVLPVEPPAAGARRPDYLLKPGAGEILTELLPLYVRNTIFRGLVESAASEHGARRTAMKSATDNAGDILDVLRRTFNRQRQAQITQEIAEIVGGAAALEQ
jgi:F-type H+-transporting ATPase subunit gamma